MTRRVLLLVLILPLTATPGGCAVAPYYEGARTHEALRNPQPDSTPRPGLPPYHDYEAERKKLLDGRQK
jgi:hypothetical protein